MNDNMTGLAPLSTHHGHSTWASRPVVMGYTVRWFVDVSGKSREVQVKNEARRFLGESHGSLELAYGAATRWMAAMRVRHGVAWIEEVFARG